MSTTTAKANSSRRLFRFSIRQLLAWTAAVAVACIALRNASPWWVATTFWLAAATLLVGVLQAVNRPGSARSYWMGFAMCGSLYLLLLIHAWDLRSDNQLQSSNNPLAFDRLPTSKLSNWLYKNLQPVLTVSPQKIAVPPGGYGEGMMIGAMDGGYGSVMPGGEMGGYGGMMPGMGISGIASPAPTGPFYISQLDFVDVSHSFWALLLASLGGWLSRLLFVTGQDKPRDQN